MIAAVLDTNILATGALTSQSAVAQLIDAWQHGLYRVFVSAELLQELERTLQKPYFTQRLALATIAAYLALVQATATTVAISSPVPRVATHPEDDRILATAV